MNFLKLCLVTNAKDISISEYKKFLAQAIEGGITSVQLREKSKSKTQLYHMAFELKAFLQPFNIPLIINDDLELAKKIEADGVHLGQTDCHPEYARDVLGPSKIIGLSVESLEQLHIANQLNCIDYVAASAVFPSITKNNCNRIWGLEGLRHFTNHSKHPVVAIGGIDVSNARKVIAHGASGIAVVSAIHSRTDPKQAAADLLSEINESE